MFYDREKFLNFLTEEGEEYGDDLVELLGATPETPFLVEIVFLQGWNRELEDRPNQKGLEVCEAYTVLYDEDDPGSQICLQIWFSYKDDDYDDSIFFTMIPDPTHPGQYGLQIYRNDNLIYERSASQDPATEWQINAMAEDDLYRLEDGQMAFHGDTTNI